MVERADHVRSLVERTARELAASLGELPSPPMIRVAAAEGQAACLILVWNSSELMPAIGPERRRRPSGGREECRADVLAVVREAGRPLTRKQVIRALREAGNDHGPGTVAKALADLTATGELVNPRDKRGYRLPEWERRGRDLFSGEH